MKVFLIGFMGSGKTHWGRQLSQKLHLPFFDLDEQIVNDAGKSISDIFSEHGEEYFRQLEKEALHIISESHQSFIMATGGGTPCYFNNIEYMNKHGLTVWLHTPQETLFDRLLKEKNHRPLLRDLSDAQLKSFIAKKMADRSLYYEQAKLKVEEREECMDTIVQKIFHA